MKSLLPGLLLLALGATLPSEAAAGKVQVTIGLPLPVPIVVTTAPAPPPPRVVVAPAPAPAAVHVPAHYVWDPHVGHAVLVPASLQVPPAPGMYWVPGRWEGRGHHKRWVDGYWAR